MTTAYEHPLIQIFDRYATNYLQEEVDQALELREELTPLFFEILEQVATNPMLFTLEDHNAHVYAAVLLAHWQEPQAHLPLIKAFSIPEEQLTLLWGDMTTETLPALLFRTHGGSTEAMKAVITNREVDQFVRCAAMEALSYVVAFDHGQRTDIVTFFQTLYTGEEAEADSFFWGNLTATLCDLHPEDSMASIQQGFAKGLIQRQFISSEDVEKARQRTREQALDHLHNWALSRMPAGLHDYISWFAEYQQQDRLGPEQEEKTTKRPSSQKKKKNKKKVAKQSRKKNRR